MTSLSDHLYNEECKEAQEMPPREECIAQEEVAWSKRKRPHEKMMHLGVASANMTAFERATRGGRLDPKSVEPRCPICMDTNDDPHWFMSRACGHVSHAQCAGALYDSKQGAGEGPIQETLPCPICRTPFHTRDLNTLAQLSAMGRMLKQQAPKIEERTTQLQEYRDKAELLRRELDRSPPPSDFTLAEETQLLELLEQEIRVLESDLEAHRLQEETICRYVDRKQDELCADSSVLSLTGIKQALLDRERRRLVAWMEKEIKAVLKDPVDSQPRTLVQLHQRRSGFDPRTGNLLCVTVSGLLILADKENGDPNAVVLFRVQGRGEEEFALYLQAFTAYFPNLSAEDKSAHPITSRPEDGPATKKKKTTGEGNEQSAGETGVDQQRPVARQLNFSYDGDLPLDRPAWYHEVCSGSLPRRRSSHPSTQVHGALELDQSN